MIKKTRSLAKEQSTLMRMRMRMPVKQLRILLSRNNEGS
jgi:hypothetical protein